MNYSWITEDSIRVAGPPGHEITDFGSGARNALTATTNYYVPDSDEHAPIDSEISCPIKRLPAMGRKIGFGIHRCLLAAKLPEQDLQEYHGFAEQVCRCAED